MSKVYIIKNNNGITCGCVERARDIAPFVFFTNVLSIDDSSLDYDYDIVDLLECDRSKEDVVAHLSNFSYTLQQIVLNQFGIEIIEEDIWNYEEYLHNKQ